MDVGQRGGSRGRQRLSYSEPGLSSESGRGEMGSRGTAPSCRRTLSLCTEARFECISFLFLECSWRMNICKSDLIVAFQPGTERCGFIYQRWVWCIISLYFVLSKCCCHHLFLFVLLFMDQVGEPSAWRLDSRESLFLQLFDL